MEALVRKTLQFIENKILMKFLLKIADEMQKKISSNSVFPLDRKSIHTGLYWPPLKYNAKIFDTATEFIQKKYSSLKQQQQHKLYLHDYMSYSIAKALRQN